jgi:hypothetical protein
MINIILHQRNRHSFRCTPTSSWAAARGDAGVQVFTFDEEGRDIDPIAPNSQHKRISISVTRIQNDSITPRIHNQSIKY